MAGKDDTFPRCILYIVVVVVVVVTFLVCVAVLTIVILLYLMPQNISAAEEGKVLIHVT